MREEFWKIPVYEDQELAGKLGAAVLRREKLHHWPLSYVEKVTLEDGRSVIYKAQHAAASVENLFYSRVRAPFLLKPVFSEEGEGWAALGLPYVEHTPRPNSSPEELKRTVERWSGMLQGLSDVPVYFDISTLGKLSALLEEALKVLAPEDGLRREMEVWMEKRAPLCYRDQPTGILHGDLRGENVITEGDRLLYIIDWQRPVLGPLPLETASAMEQAGFPLKGDPFGELALVFNGIWYEYANLHLLPFPDLKETARGYFQRAVNGG